MLPVGWRAVHRIKNRRSRAPMGRTVVEVDRHHAASTDQGVAFLGVIKAMLDAHWIEFQRDAVPNGKREGRALDPR